MPLIAKPLADSVYTRGAELEFAALAQGLPAHGLAPAQGLPAHGLALAQGLPAYGLAPAQEATATLLKLKFVEIPANPREIIEAVATTTRYLSFISINSW